MLSFFDAGSRRGVSKAPGIGSLVKQLHECMNRGDQPAAARIYIELEKALDSFGAAVKGTDGSI